MKKIILITNTSYTLLSLRMSLMKNLKNSGYDVYAAAPKDKYSDIIMKNGIGFKNIRMSQAGMNIIEEIWTFFSLIKVFFNLKPDIIGLYSIKTIVWGSLASLFFPTSKIVSTFTGMGILRSCGDRLRGILFGMISFSHRRNKKYVFQNQSDLEFFENHTRISDCTYLINGSGVDTEFFKRNRESSNKITFLMFSRMFYSKGVLDYLSAVKQLNSDFFDKANFKLLGGAYPSNPNQIDEEWLLGSDAIDSALLLSESTEANVEWIEHDNNVLKYLNKSDVVLLPTYYPEGLPRSLLEAMSCENAIITTKMPGCEEVVDGSNGFLVSPKNVNQLRNCIEKFISMSNSDLNKMKKRSREIILNKFSDEIIINEYKKIYSSFFN